MKVRYKNGKAVASIYSKEEHGISINDMDKDAIFVVKKLVDNGFDSYIVGGSVRDLLLGKSPKDFDVVTQATPRQVHKLFKNSRNIGRRFKIVHVIFGEKIIEVSTFRSLQDHVAGNDNIFGTIEEDSQRRDFSINSLYFNPFDETIIDFTNSYDDFRKKKIRSLIPLNRTFEEDPVRMIRAIKYSVTTGFKMENKLKRAIRHNASNLSKVGSSRLTEELTKILSSSYSSLIFKELNRFGLLVYILPCLSVYASFPNVYDSLSNLDQMIKSNKKAISKAQMYLYLVLPLITTSSVSQKSYNERCKDIVRQIKVALTPCTPANIDIDNAAKLYLSMNKITNSKVNNSKKSK